MKKIILNIFSLLAFSIAVNAQEGVGIETETIGEKALLDFPSGAKKGILLPRVKDKTTAGTTYGTFLYDKKSNKVLFYGHEYITGPTEDIPERGTDRWLELTPDANGSTLDNFNSGETGGSQGVVITDKSNVDLNVVPKGVLTLESDSRALVLPVVENVAELPSPKAGLICYDKNSKSLAIFNGEKWYFWN